MKRYFKNLITNFSHWIMFFDWQEIVGFGTATILGIVTAILLFVSIDKTPATASDFEQLEEKVRIIQQEPSTLFKTDCTMEVENQLISFTLENDECSVTATLDQNYEILSLSREDNYTFGLFAFIVCLFYCIIIVFIGGLLLTDILLVITNVVHAVSKK